MHADDVNILELAHRASDGQHDARPAQPGGAWLWARRGQHAGVPNRHGRPRREREPRVCRVPA